MSNIEFNPVQTNRMPVRAKIKNLIWKITNKTIFRFTPSCFSLFRKYRVLLLKAFGANINWSASIHPSVLIEYPWNLSMGELSSLGEHSWVYCLDKVFIGKRCCIGKDVYLITGTHDISSPNFDLVLKPITIKNNVWVATGAKILPGVIIESDSVVAADALVSKNIQANSVVGGNPAKFIKNRFTD